MSAVLAPERRYVDTPTRYEGVFARHRLSCALAIGRKRCTCTPSYYGIVWDPAIRRNRRTKRVALIREAKNLRDDLQARVRKGTVTDRPRPVFFEDARREFIADCRAKVVLNKQGRPYTPKAITNLESSLGRLPESLRKKRLEAITPADFQHAVDGFRREELSSSRIGAIVNAARSFYRWAIARGKATGNAPGSIRLPAPDSTERDRVATPGEFARLLDLLDPRDALPWAIAGYGTARLQEIQVLEWPEVDFEHDVMLLAGDEDARKSEAARRIVPIVRPLRRRLYAEWVRQGRPTTGRVCPPRKRSRSGLLSLNQLSKRVARKWEDAGLRPIGLQDSRHTAATWLDHAGVAPKVSSVFMGHKAPRRQADAAPITLRRYTHVLPGELERARDQLDVFLVTREEEEQHRSFKVGRDG
ncbi:MAG TPA: tyrosine-type recombinase/integrase [Solirubrobacterales bacterium]|nr:tyrosine-type recombinase/integrase [Solirubrobacterales bacterium]